jgi:hypothetical protein
MSMDPLKFIAANLTPSVILPPGFHSQMLFFVAPIYYRHLLIVFVGVWVYTQVSATLSRPVYGLNLLVLRYHFEFGFISREQSLEHPQ